MRVSLVCVDKGLDAREELAELLEILVLAHVLSKLLHDVCSAPENVETVIKRVAVWRRDDFHGPNSNRQAWSYGSAPIRV